MANRTLALVRAFAESVAAKGGRAESIAEFRLALQAWLAAPGVAVLDVHPQADGSGFCRAPRQFMKKRPS